jgi:hypothetical protein
VLVTSRRRRLGLPEAWHLEVDRLAGQQALDLLTNYAGAVRTGDQAAAVRELVRICDGLPLALRIVGEWLARRPGLPAGLLATHLTRRPLDGLRAGNLSVRDALAADLRPSSTTTRMPPASSRCWRMGAPTRPRRWPQNSARTPAWSSSPSSGWWTSGW